MIAAPKITQFWANTALLALGAVLTAIFFKGRFDQNTQRLTTFIAGALAASIPFVAAGFVAWHAPPARSTLLIVLGFGLLFRVGPLLSTPYLSTDPYRYVWDGRVQAHGINPYRYVPADPALAGLRDGAIYEHINRKTYAKTVYPPGSQVVFLLLTRVSESFSCVRITMVLCEALAVCNAASPGIPLRTNTATDTTGSVCPAGGSGAAGAIGGHRTAW